MITIEPVSHMTSVTNWNPDMDTGYGQTMTVNSYSLAVKQEQDISQT